MKLIEFPEGINLHLQRITVKVAGGGGGGLLTGWVQKVVWY